MVTQVAAETKFDVVFTESTYDPAYETPWHKSLREAFPPDEPLTFWVNATMTAAQFRAMTGTDDISGHIGYVLEHYDGPGVFGADMAAHETDALSDAINDADGNNWDPIDPDELTPEGWQALLSVMKDVLNMDWNVQRDLVDDAWVENNRDKIALFMKPASDC